MTFPVDYVLDGDSLNSTAFRKVFQDNTSQGSWEATGDAEQSRVSKVFKTKETFKRLYAGKNNSFSFKGGEWLNVRMGTKGFSGSTYYAWRSMESTWYILDSATTLAAGAVALATTLAF